MTRMKAFLAGSAIATVIGMSAAAVVAAPGQGPRGPEGVSGPGFHHGAIPKARAEGHGWKGRHGKRDCGERAGPMERQINVIEGLMEFTPAQKTAWGELKTAIGSGKETMQKACEARKDQERPKNAVERLNRFEEGMSSRLAVMRSVKPSFEKFYGTLSEKQQKAIDGLFTRGRRG
jgi:hypothetical protein